MKKLALLAALAFALTTASAGYAATPSPLNPDLCCKKSCDRGGDKEKDCCKKHKDNEECCKKESCDKK